MIISVIAANGRTGKEFVKVALEAGHKVRAGVRGQSNFNENANLTVVECDATNHDQVANLIKGSDAVVSFIGHVKGSPANVQTDAITTVIEAMKQQGIKRIVSLTGTGVRFPGDKITLVDRILNLSIGIIDPARISDGIKHVEVLKSSDLDWTILRVLKLQNTKPTGFNLTDNGPTKNYISRVDVAEAALEVLEKNSFIKWAPILSKAH